MCKVGHCNDIVENKEQQNSEETSWAKLIFIFLILIVSLGVVVVGLIQNYYALKTITELPKLMNSTGIESMPYVTIKETSNLERTCYENNIEINCSVIDKIISIK